MTRVLPACGRDQLREKRYSNLNEQLFYGTHSFSEPFFLRTSKERHLLLLHPDSLGRFVAGGPNLSKMSKDAFVFLGHLGELRVEDVWNHCSRARREVDSSLPALVVFFLITVPLTLTYFWYVYVPWAILSWLWGWVVVLLQVLCRRSKHAKEVLIHVSALMETLSSMLHKVKQTKLGDMLRVVRQMVADLVQSLRNPGAKDLHTRRKIKSLSIAELAELLAYEELDEPAPEINKQRVHRVMHRDIPTNPFRATVRLKRYPQGGGALVAADGHPAHHSSTSSNGGGSSNHDTDSLPEEVAYLLDKDSPTSFPTTPFSRARIMYRSAERTDTVRFSRVGVLYRPARQDAPFAH